MVRFGRNTFHTIQLSEFVGHFPVVSNGEASLDLTAHGETPSPCEQPSYWAPSSA